MSVVLCQFILFLIMLFESTVAGLCKPTVYVQGSLTLWYIVIIVTVSLLYHATNTPGREGGSLQFLYTVMVHPLPLY